jgi:twinfilin-like protein
MAHQTGIEPSEELKELISTALKGSLRYIKISIENEKLVQDGSSATSGSWEDDLDSMILPQLFEDKPCYIFYRLDERNSYQNFLWVFMSYTPDNAKVRDKMLYAATKATVRKAFQSGVVVDDIAATTKDELSLAGYRRHLESQKAAPPLSQTEVALQELQLNEDRVDVGTATRQSHLHGVAFPIDQDAFQALQQLGNKELAYVRLAVEVSKERIYLDTKKESMTADGLPAVVPDGHPSYHFFLFKHTFEGDYQESIVFIYSCPGFKSSIKERMLYSSCKEPLVSVVEDSLKIEVVKKVCWLL